MSRYRLNASCTTRGLGQQPPLLRLMIVRSSVKPCWISRQYVSSLATSAGPASPTRAAADATRARLSFVNAVSATAPVVPALRKLRRLSISFLSPSEDGGVFRDEVAEVYGGNGTTLHGETE